MLNRYMVYEFYVAIVYRSLIDMQNSTVDGRPISGLAGSLQQKGVSNVSLFGASFSQLLAFLCQFNCYGTIAEPLEAGNKGRLKWIRLDQGMS